MPSCSVLGCNNKSAVQTMSNGGITYHRFPKNPVIKEHWMNATGRQNWFPLKFSTICSSHFHDEDFIIKKSGNRYLTDSAVPTRNILQFHLHNRSDSSIASPSNVILVTTKRKLDDEGDMLPEVTNKFKSNSTPTNSSSRTLSVSTPREGKLKAIISNKDSVIKRQRLQIKRIQAQNCRLRKKVNKLEDVLKSLKEKNHFRTEDIITVQNTNVKVELMNVKQEALEVKTTAQQWPEFELPAINLTR